jgi:chemotaxis protein CheX
MNTAAATLTRCTHSHENWNLVLEVAAREVFDLMLGCKLTTPATPPAESHDMTAMVGIAGQLCGVLILGCSVESSTLIASRMLGVQPAEIGSEACDAFGEICNMIAGNFKNKISGLGNGCMLSVPAVISGGHYHVHPLSRSEAVEVTLLFEGAPISISLRLHNQSVPTLGSVLSR